MGRHCVRALLRADGRDEHGCASPLAEVPSSLEELSAATYLPGGLSLGEDAAKQLGGCGWRRQPETTFHVRGLSMVLPMYSPCTCDALSLSFPCTLHARSMCVGTP